MKKCLYCDTPQGSIFTVTMGGQIFHACERCYKRIKEGK